MATTSQSSRFSPIVLAVKRQLGAVTGLDPTHVRVVANDNYELTSVEPRLLVVRYYGLQPFVDAGAGRRARPASRLVRVYVYTRIGLDTYGSDEITLTDDGAHGDFEELVLDALDDHWPVTEDGDTVLTVEPLHVLDAGRGPPERKAENDVGVCRSHLDFECRYLLPNRTPRPT